MDVSMERMSIACVHCAKAKAKCDKKVPCSRCVTKQLLCQSRPTRRSANMAFRRNNASKARPGSVHSSAPFHLSEFSHPDVNQSYIPHDLDLDFFGLANQGTNFGTHDSTDGSFNRQSLPDLDYAQLLGNGALSYESDPHLSQNGFSESPPDLSVSITPVEQEGPSLDDLMPNLDHWDHQPTYDPMITTMGSEADLTAAFDMAHVLDTISPREMPPLSSPFLDNAPKTSPLPLAPVDPAITSQKPHSQMDHGPGAAPPRQPMALEDSDALMRSQESWPFFCCDRIPKTDVFPPKTAAFYVEGLVTVLTAQDWQMPPNLHAADVGLGATGSPHGAQASEPAIGHAADALTTATEIILSKARMTHGRAENVARIKLPPHNTMAGFVQSYVRHHEPYYACAMDLRHSNLPLLQSNVQASHLLMLMAVAQGASFTPLSAARYFASGMVEACRLFLFDSIEKDILLSREPIILKSALLFTIASAWSGDNWQMDIAMGQRGMYISMLVHARMLNGREKRPGPDELRSGSEKAWRDWRDLEERRRIAYSWVIVDQELSLFSDTAPLLDVASLQAPMPSSDQLWRAPSAKEWCARYNDMSTDERVDGSSLRDLFTSFVEGDLSDSNLNPLHLRLLLHPLQTLVCQLRQFLNCLPDSGRRPMGTSMSKAATKARLEEISTLLQQWYGFAERHSEGEGNARWTLTANLIMYHLICLTTRTSMGFIEQFARGEVQTGSARQASQWLQGHGLDDVPQVLVHCGQVLRLVRCIPPQFRPPWWSGAVYRVALIAWATCICHAGSGMPLDNNAETDKPFAVDALVPEDPSIQHYLRYREGMPTLSNGNGSLVPMNKPSNILQHCVNLLEEDLSTRVTEGITRKLRGLLASWKDRPFGIKA